MEARLVQRLVRNRRRCTTDALGQGRPRPDSRPDKLIELAPRGHATPDRPVDRSSTAGWPGPDGTSCSGADEERRARVGGLVFGGDDDSASRRWRSNATDIAI